MVIIVIPERDIFYYVVRRRVNVSAVQPRVSATRETCFISRQNYPSVIISVSALRCLRVLLNDNNIICRYFRLICFIKEVIILRLLSSAILSPHAHLLSKSILSNFEQRTAIRITVGRGNVEPWLVHSWRHCLAKRLRRSTANGHEKQCRRKAHGL